MLTKLKLTIVIILVLSTAVIADELAQMHIVDKPQLSESDFIGANNKDVNGRICAGIKIISEMDGFTYDSYNGVVDVDHKSGQDLVFLSADERVLEIFHLGYEPLKIILSEHGIHLEPKRIWTVKIKGDVRPAIPEGKGGFSVKTNPRDVEVTVEGLPGIVKKTPCEFNELFILPYRFRLSRDRYLPIDTVISVVKNSIVELILDMTPTFGNLEARSDPPAEVLLNGKSVGITPVILRGEVDGLDVGQYSLKIRKVEAHESSYISVTKQINITSGETVTISEKLKEITGSLSLKSNKKNTQFKITDLQDNIQVFKGAKVKDMELLTGSYKIEASVSEHMPIIKSVNIVEDMESKENFKFTKQHNYAYIEAQKQKDVDFGKNVLGAAENDTIATITDRTFLTHMFYYYDGPAFGTPVLGRFLRIVSDVREREKKISLFYSWGMIGEAIITPKVGYLNIISLGGGALAISEDHRNRYIFEISAAFAIEYPFKPAEYNDRELQRTLLMDDSAGTGGPIYDWGIVPLRVKFSYERHLFNKSFLIIQIGALYAKKDWYYKDEIDAWNNNEGDKPSPVSGPGIPDTYYLDGIKPMIGIGIRWL